MIKQTLTALAMMAIFSAPAEAHRPRCTGDGQALLIDLSENWGEVMQGEPLQVTPQVVEVLTANPERGNWSRLSLGADGSACMQISGYGFNGKSKEDAIKAPLPPQL